MLIQSRGTTNASPIVELAGLAGAGKTTVLQALCQRNPQICPGISLSKVSQLSLRIENSLFWFPTFIQEYRHSRWFKADEIRSMVYLKAWYQFLEKQAGDHPALIFDHGPLFRLAFLQEFGPEITKSEKFDRWWNEMFDRWTATLDLVIWLEAPDAVLLQRIQTRTQKHLIQGKAELEGYEFLSRYHRSFKQILTQLTRHKHLKVLRFNTQENTPDQIVDCLLTALDIRTT